jgi:hypothetical protein
MALQLQIRISRARPGVLMTSVKYSRISGGSGDQSTEKVLSERKLEYGRGL